MSWKPIVVGVDASPEAAWAAALGADLAERAGTSCHLVHAIREVGSALAFAELPERAAEFTAAQIAQAREQVMHGLWGVVPPTLVQDVTVRIGRPAVVLNDVVDEIGAGLAVLGGKHHSVLGRWLAGSTGVDVARTALVPVLVTGSSRTPIRQVLAAVDVSPAAEATIATAERYAELLGAQLRVVSVLEPLPIVPGAPSYHPAEYFNLLEEDVTKRVWPLVTARGAERFVRYGAPVDVIMKEAAAWEADLVVVGSHGKSWVDRLLIGSVTERLLNQLPTSLLVVPPHAHQHGYESAHATPERTYSEPAFA